MPSRTALCELTAFFEHFYIEPCITVGIVAIGLGRLDIIARSANEAAAIIRAALVFKSKGDVRATTASNVVPGQDAGTVHRVATTVDEPALLGVVRWGWCHRRGRSGLWRQR